MGSAVDRPGRDYIGQAPTFHIASQGPGRSRAGVLLSDWAGSGLIRLVRTQLDPSWKLVPFASGSNGRMCWSCGAQCGALLTPQSDDRRRHHSGEKCSSSKPAAAHRPGSRGELPSPAKTEPRGLD
ncbi:hypothetical protein PtA15_9A72 [Puccinia triticina]|uniref:C2H2-type domain-containing protein n=1 Tax=Puccinia triticina TaxID=208348 RepID=A0ABY7CSP3_9BASI|nr:uncharacterized protein PtA15_9A72 [Puccinia triticina]WAQ87948.1 hypothetical protein PtA15_9A72 [Puccinia triticina]